MFLRSRFSGFRSGLYWAPDGGDGGNSGGGTPPADSPAGDGGGATPQTWETWFEAQSDEVKNLYKAHHDGLLNTVKATRTERDQLAQQLKDATSKLQEGSEVRQALESLSGQLETANRRAAFYEQATSREVGCRNPRLAWLAAQESGAIDDKGAVNWETLKQGYPELFGPTQPPTPKVPPTNPAGGGSDAFTAALYKGAGIKRE